jgi:hypothetical protein
LWGGAHGRSVKAASTGEILRAGSGRDTIRAHARDRIRACERVTSFRGGALIELRGAPEKIDRE